MSKNIIDTFLLRHMVRAYGLRGKQEMRKKIEQLIIGLKAK